MGWSWWRFFWGFVGACAPEILRIYRIATGRSRARVFYRNMPLYIFAAIGVIVLGGLFAVAWGEDNPWQCLGVGASSTLAISAIATQAT